MKLFVGDYLADTTHLTTVEHGAYLLLLMAMWRAGGKLPDDDDRLARITGLAVSEWRAIREAIRDGFFKREGAFLVHKRLAKELSKYTTRTGRKNGVETKNTHVNSEIGTPEIRHISESESEDSSLRSESEKPDGFSPLTFPQKFALFYEAYPVKKGRLRAETAFEQALKRATFEELMAGLDVAKTSNRDWARGFIKHPATWLNQGCWADQPGIGELNVRRAGSERAAALNGARHDDLFESPGLRKLRDIGAAMEAAVEQRRSEARG